SRIDRRLAKFFRAFLNVAALPERILDHVCEARRLKCEDGKRMKLDALLSLPDLLFNFEGIRDLLNKSLVWTEEKHVQWLNHSGGASRNDQLLYVELICKLGRDSG